MRKRLFILLTTMAMLISVFAGGCGKAKLDDFEIVEATLSTDSEETDSAQAEENSRSEEKIVYTMDDIRQLEHTENFAENTLEHIFDGTINSKGKATGYHSTLVSDSKGSIIDGTRSDTDEHGVFTGKVTVDGVEKNGFSSFYPESWMPQEIVDAINTAYEYALNDSSNPKGSLWIGCCGDLEIDMYLNDSMKIITAFPIYEGD